MSVEFTISNIKNWVDNPQWDTNPVTSKNRTNSMTFHLDSGNSIIGFFGERWELLDWVFISNGIAVQSPLVQHNYKAIENFLKYQTLMVRMGKDAELENCWRKE